LSQTWQVTDGAFFKGELIKELVRPPPTSKTFDDIIQSATDEEKHDKCTISSRKTSFKREICLSQPSRPKDGQQRGVALRMAGA